MYEFEKPLTLFQKKGNVKKVVLIKSILFHADDSYTNLYLRDDKAFVQVLTLLPTYLLEVQKKTFSVVLFKLLEMLKENQTYHSQIVALLLKFSPILKKMKLKRSEILSYLFAEKRPILVHCSLRILLKTSLNCQIGMLPAIFKILLTHTKSTSNTFQKSLYSLLTIQNNFFKKNLEKSHSAYFNFNFYSFLYIFDNLHLWSSVFDGKFKPFPQNFEKNFKNQAYIDIFMFDLNQLWISFFQNQFFLGPPSFDSALFDKFEKLVSPKLNSYFNG